MPASVRPAQRQEACPLKVRRALWLAFAIDLGENVGAVKSKPWRPRSPQFRYKQLGSDRRSFANQSPADRWAQHIADGLMSASRPFPRSAPCKWRVSLLQSNTRHT